MTNRYLWGAAVDQLLADEQYNAGSGPAVSAGSASATTGNTLWALTDHLGSVRDLVDNNGVIREHNVYDSFGRLVREIDYNTAGVVIASTDAAAVDTLFGYTARDFDADVGLQYNRARWYDPTTGRWLSQDPIGFGGGDANLYRYVGNRATGLTDPSGLEENPLLRKFQNNSLMRRNELLREYGPQPNIFLRPRMLSSQEFDLVQRVFGDSIDCTKVGVARGGWPGQGGNAVTPFGIIYFPPAYFRDNFANTPDDDWFIHEMVHVWQYQRGMSVIDNAAKEFATHFGHYHGVYVYDPGELGKKMLTEFNFEQQAVIVQQYFDGKFNGQFFGTLKAKDMRNAEISMQGLGFPMVPVIPPVIPARKNSNPSNYEVEILPDDFWGPFPKQRTIPQAGSSRRDLECEG